MNELDLISSNEAHTTRVGSDIAAVLKPGDLVFLQGNLGVGKSVLARAIVRHLAGDNELEVPSPTYTLCQQYDSELPVAHLDLYRLSQADEINELGLDDILVEGCALIEWPERAFDHLPENTVRIVLSDKDSGQRSLNFSGNAEIISRLKRSFLIRDFLVQTGCGDTERKHLTGDASARSYELVSCNNKNALLMNSPAAPDGPPVKHGKPYSRIAHIAEDVRAFVGIDKLLREYGFNAPEIIGTNLDDGLLLIEHLGSQGILDASGSPVTQRYKAAIEFLARLHEIKWPKDVVISSGYTHHIPPYDPEAMLIEVALLTDWYLPEFSKHPLSVDQQEQFREIWLNYADHLQATEHTLVLRDFHSPNVLWCEEKTGTDRIGVIDFQDAVIGPSAYDVASLAQDARVDISREMEMTLLDHYISTRMAGTLPFDEVRFRADYALMAAQRATKILGIFVRLNRRDGKPVYLNHLPRIQEYLKRSLQHPVCSELKTWVESVTEL